MPKKSFILFLALYLISSILTTPIMAEPLLLTDPTTCDLCGWCNKDTTPQPPNWDKCVECIYEIDQTTGEAKRKEHAFYTVLGCLSTEPGVFVQSLLTLAFGIAGGIAFLSVLAGSAIVLTSSGDPERLQNGKNIIISSIAGIFLIFLSVFLLKFVGFDILKIPGLG